MSRARKNSPAARAHHIRMREVMRGRHPKQATATRSANRVLEKLGLTKVQAPALWQGYYEFYLKRHEGSAEAE